MKNIILFLSLLSCASGMNGQQDKLLYKASDKCKLFADKQNLNNEVQEIGVYEAFPELVYPKANEIEQSIGKKINQPIDVILLLKISRTGQVECIYLLKGDIKEDVATKLSKIIVTDFVFKPAARRGKHIASIFNLKISI
jgi:hypothetical protein